MRPNSAVFVFNPFAEGYLARGKAFTPVRHQAMLAEDLANLPQFLGGPDDIVLVGKRPAAEFLESVRQAGFALPEFVELREGCIDLADDVWQRELGAFRPWAWAPDSVQLFEPLFARLDRCVRAPNQFFNDDIAQLYSKAWSAAFLRRLSRRAAWLCSEQETGVAADTLDGALEVIASIRSRGHQRIVVKEALGVAGHNALRLWEPEVLPAQRQWLARALTGGRQVIIEPWLERMADFSVQLEMSESGLRLCGYTGLVNDEKGQFQANWANSDFERRLPDEVSRLFPELPGQWERYYGEVFSLLEGELRRIGFSGPIGIDAFAYRTPEGIIRLKPVVEINPRYTMGRVTVELMKQASPGTCGLFRLVSQRQARALGFSSLAAYAETLVDRFPLCLEANPAPKIREGALCLNDPRQARVCLATFQVNSELQRCHPT